MKPSPEPVSAPKGMGPQEKLKISLDGIRGAAVPKSTVQKNYFSQNEVGQSTRVTQITKMSKTNSKAQAKNESQDMIMKFAFVAILGFASFFGYKNFIKPSEQNNTTIAGNKINSAKKVLENQGQIDMGSTAKVTVSISSTPSGARIFIDGRDTGQLTPSVVPLIANKDLNISMVKEGFSKYETTKKFEQTSSFSATLQRQISGGYVNIYVVNGGAKPAVFVNGQRLTEELPIKKYRIPANVDTIIYAENAITQLKDQIKIKVAADQVSDVELILGRTPTATAEKK